MSGSIEQSINRLREDLEATTRDRDRLIQSHRQATEWKRSLESMRNIAVLQGDGDYLQVKDEIERFEGAIRRQNDRADELRKQIIDRELEEARTEREGRDFWFRRFMLSLQIGNGAAFLATVAGVLQADKDVFPTVAALAWGPSIYFGLGVIAAGLLPLLMAARRAFPSHPRIGRAAYFAVLLMTAASMVLFAFGAGSVMVELTQVRKPALEAAARTMEDVAAPIAKANALALEKAKATTQNQPATGDLSKNAGRPVAPASK